MRTLNLLHALEFDDARPRAEPLLVHPGGRVLRFCLRPGQRIHEHCAPHSPVHLVLLRGHGLFAGEGGVDTLAQAGELVVFAAGEVHRVRALDEDLAFVALLEPAPGPQAQGIARQPEEDAYLTWLM